MFYQLEREFVLRKVLCSEEEQKEKADADGDAEVALFKNDPLMPERYRDLPLREDWYISGKSKKPSKRKHRKSHGKIGFLELTRMIAARWANVDEETRKYCKMMAAMELVKYKEDLDSYKAYRERLGAFGQIPEDMKQMEAKKMVAAERKRAKDKFLNGMTSTKEKPAATRSNEPKRAAPAKKARAAKRTAKNDDEMEQFISSLVDQPKALVSPDRPVKRPRIVESEQPHASIEDQLVGIKMAFSGIDENEIAREFSNSIPGPYSFSIPGPPPMPLGYPSSPGILMDFDYWDELVGGVDL